jgi:heme/copper-type cytochrome/quinol oxidase subunit 2
MMYAVVTLIVAGIFSVICAFYRYRDQEAAKGH